MGHTIIILFIVYNRGDLNFDGGCFLPGGYPMGNLIFMELLRLKNHFGININDNSNLDMLIPNQLFSVKFKRKYKKNEQAKLKENVL